MLQSMGLQRVGHDSRTEQQQCPNGWRKSTGQAQVNVVQGYTKA